jgi:hypothetical protein
MSWIRTFIRRHLIAGDTVPEYSRIDQLDGRTATPESTLTAAEARHTVGPAATPTDPSSPCPGTGRQARESALDRMAFHAGREPDLSASLSSRSNENRVVATQA